MRVRVQAPRDGKRWPMVVVPFREVIQIWRGGGSSEQHRGEYPEYPSHSPSGSERGAARTRDSNSCNDIRIPVNCVRPVALARSTPLTPLLTNACPPSRTT